LKGLIIAAAIAAVLLFLALIRVGVWARYAAEGVLVKAKVFAFSFTVYPRDKKEPPKKKKEKKKKPEKEAEQKKPKGGAAEKLPVILEAAGRVLGRLRRKLSVDRLTVHYVSGCDDPCDAAIHYGMASAGAGVILSFLDRALKIRRYDVTTDVAFTGEGDTVYAELQLSLALWEVIYIALGTWPLLKLTTKKQEKKDRTAVGKVDDHG